MNHLLASRLMPSKSLSNDCFGIKTYPFSTCTAFFSAPLFLFLSMMFYAMEHPSRQLGWCLIHVLSQLLAHSNLLIVEAMWEKEKALIPVQAWLSKSQNTDVLSNAVLLTNPKYSTIHTAVKKADLLTKTA